MLLACVKSGRSPNLESPHSTQKTFLALLFRQNTCFLPPWDKKWYFESSFPEVWLPGCPEMTTVVLFYFSTPPFPQPKGAAGTDQEAGTLEHWP